MARSRCTPREPLTSTTSPGRRFWSSQRPAASASGRKSEATPPAQAAAARCWALPWTPTTRSRPASAAARAAGGVQRGAVLAQLQHFAGDQNAAACGGTRGEGANHGAQRLGVGVVAVVEDGGAADLDHLAALVAGGERFEARRRRQSRSTPASRATASPAMALEALCAPSRCSVNVPSRSPAR